MERAEGSPLPDRFRSLPGGVFPLFHALAEYELKAHTIVPNTPLGDVLAS